MGEGWEGVTLPAAQAALPNKTPGNGSEKIEKLGPAEWAWRSIPEAFRAGGRTGEGLLDHSKPARSSAAVTTRPESAGSALMRPRQRRAPARRSARRDPCRGRNGLAILAHRLQAHLDRLACIRLRFFQGFAIADHRRQLGAGDREPAFGLRPEAAEISDNHLPT